VDLKLGDVVSSLWTNFVKTRNPNGMGMPAWPAYDPKSEVLLKIGDTLKAQPAPFKTELVFLEE
jgi:para-nitrobenzyl esterase